MTNTLLESEFEIQELDYGQNTNVKFYMTNDCNFTCELIENNDKIGFIMTDGKLDCSNVKNVIYIDSPSVFDNDLKNKPHHFRYLSKLLSLSKMNDDVYDREFNKKQDNFSKRIQEIIGGYIYYNKKTNEFLFKKDNKDYSMKTTASGIKQMGIIQFLLKNRVLDKNTFLIIDEVETNLHPEWQVKFAQIIVLLIKQLNISIYINSHSPHFIEAIEVYSTKYGLKDNTCFYLTQPNNNGTYTVEQIYFNNLYKLYNNLGDPYDIVDAVRGENLARDL